MTKVERVIQIGFDIGVGENVPQHELESLIDSIRFVIDTWIDIDNKPCPLACLNDGHYHITNMDEVYKQGYPDVYERDVDDLRTDIGHVS